VPRASYRSAVDRWQGVTQPPAQGSHTFAGWRDLLSDRIARLDVVATARDSRFRGSISEVTVGAVRVDRVTVRADPYVVKRVLPPRTEARAPVVVCVQIHGQSVVHQDGREAVVRPGDLVLFDAARSYQVFYPGGTHAHVALRLPHEIVRRSLVSLVDVTAVTVSGNRGMGAAVAPLLAGLHTALAGLDATAGSRLIGHAVDLVAGAFVPHDHGTRREGRLLHAQRFIRANLDNDDLDPAAVAAALNISVSHLHRLFRGTGMTVYQAILSARLERCATELRDAAHHDETVTKIAHQNGFKDAAHFTRVFLRGYGETPSRWRRNACQPE
jgi:AraC-like DNA-binding protein